MPLELIALWANLTAEHADTQAGPGLAGGRRGAQLNRSWA